MACSTSSVAPSIRSESRTSTRPSRRRMVLLRLAKGKNWTLNSGSGARGRNSRYACSKRIVTLGFTKSRLARVPLLLLFAGDRVLVLIFVVHIFTGYIGAGFQGVLGVL